MALVAPAKTAPESPILGQPAHSPRADARAMVEQRTLTPSILVRIQVPQPGSLVSGVLFPGWGESPTFIRNSDPAKLEEAERIFKNSMPDNEYPVGTFLQLLPGDAMVKHSRAKFPDTNGWEFWRYVFQAPQRDSPALQVQ
ncbi:MAG: hypothetical protein ACR2KT_03740 [Methylocella sp.]|nr:MAG: hypothetical protein DLM68_09110 [Hyphomicrobiales bacterium]